LVHDFVSVIKRCSVGRSGAGLGEWRIGVGAGPRSPAAAVVGSGGFVRTTPADTQDSDHPEVAPRHGRCIGDRLHEVRGSRQPIAEPVTTRSRIRSPQCSDPSAADQQLARRTPPHEQPHERPAPRASPQLLDRHRSAARRARRPRAVSPVRTYNRRPRTENEPNRKLVTAKGTSHEVPTERPDLVLKAIEDGFATQH